MSFFQLTKKDLIINFREREFWLILLLMPFVLTIIFTAVFGNEDNFSLFPIEVALLNSDQGTEQIANFSLGNQFLEFLNYDQLSNILKIRPANSESEITQLILDGQITVGIIIPSNFTESVFGSSPSEIQVLGDPGSLLAPGIVHNIVDSFVTTVEANRIQLFATLTMLEKYQVGSDRMMEVLAEQIGSPAVQSVPINFTNHTREGKAQLTGTNYYAAAMAVMFLLFAANAGIYSIIEEKENRTMQRLKLCTLSKTSLVFGKFLLVVLIGLFQITVLILATSLLLKVNWGQSLAGLIYVTVTSVIAISTLSILVAALTKSAKAANNLNWVAIQILAFLGGSYIPITAMPPFLQSISKLVPNGQALRGFVTLMEGGTLRDVLPNGLILLGTGAIFLLIGSYFLSYEGEGM